MDSCVPITSTPEAGIDALRNLWRLRHLIVNKQFDALTDLDKSFLRDHATDAELQYLALELSELESFQAVQTNLVPESPYYVALYQAQCDLRQGRHDQSLSTCDQIISSISEELVLDSNTSQSHGL
jgi:hypothetical protein